MLIGVGLGPGSPDLLTLAAIKALKNSRKVFVPGKLAAELVAPYAKAEILDFPMIQDKTELLKMWENNANKVANEAGKGTVSFAVIGDPNFFSTFSHLRRTIKEKYPDIEITTIPGVSAITAQAARTDTSIEGSFTVSDGSPVRTKIILKTKHPENTREKLTAEGFDEFIYAERLFMENEKVTHEIPQNGDYFSILVAKKSKKAAEKKVVYFVGAGPGNPKYITVKGRELLESADLVMYTGSLINLEILDYTQGKKIDSHGMKLEDIIDMLAKNVEAGKTVVRLHSGDPSLYGAIIEQIDGLKKCGINIEIIPGVTSLFAAAAALRTQLTLNGITETLIITRPAGETLEKDSIHELSRHSATMAIYLGTHKLREIMRKVAYPKDTPAAVVYHASWDDEKVILGTVGDIADRAEALGIDKSAMIIIGNVLSPENYKRSHLYG
ncbi:cobalt-factor II C(20)-methyltransferase [Candidatus Methanoperedens nitratireducens]|uniref:Putative cobalt-precorrin-4 C(11)-methyltransferase (Modular protein) n=1 Tax=Candidatus Methanoperedens nitratireducens TaxID=1392998 RepID=A0A284VLG9_9EURY|nr:cobalt-factor II C(20)-methyltransferase [Candidatus Methanoperedens nitroreducens]SNQ60098.1 putative cobalt-precorrin-4 C(11)-methyltransferase (modular protein) [Candidatus Methanoperedens nitroreducens]